MLTLYAEHFAFGLLFAGTGAYARNFCQHNWHKIALGVALVLAETIGVVNIVG